MSSKARNSYQAVPMEMSMEADPVEVYVERKKPEKKDDFSNSEAKFIAGAALLVSALSILLILMITSTYQPISTGDMMASDTGFDPLGRYIIKNFDLAKPMSNFLPGLGGLWGVPMWAFYVNRGQGITSFGKFSKDSAIAKFVTAEKAYQQTPFTVFRTFIKGKRTDEEFQYMPFFPRTAKDTDAIERNMIIGTNEMEIEEINTDLKLKTNVLYYTASEQDFPAIVRSVTFTNLDPNLSLEIEVLDGLGRLIPNGLGNGNIDTMGRTMEAWMNVYNVGSAQNTGDHVTQPFYHISQDTGDNAQVKLIKDGYFAVAYVEGEAAGPDGLKKLLPFVVDPTVVYELDTSLVNPDGFFASTAVPIEDFTALPQGTTSRTPCAFAGTKLTITGGASSTITSIYGYAEDLQTFIGKYSPIIRKPDYSPSKRLAAQAIVADITKRVVTKTANPVFDAYVQQDFLDNVLRGGLPMQIGPAGAEKIFHVFSRIHGDIERDYNYFIIDTTYFSQGPGNFRDVNQNRRTDVFHSPFVGDFNLRMFLSFVQADGFNPLTVASTVFKIPGPAVENTLINLKIVDIDTAGTSRQKVRELLYRSFRPGQFFRDASALNIQFGIDREAVVEVLIGAAVQEFAGQYAQNGFWADHWTYTLDLLDGFLAIFPDQEQNVLYDSQPVPFYMSPAYVKPRSARYSVMDGKVRSYTAVSTWGESDFSSDRVAAMNLIFQDPNYIVDNNGAASVWQRTRDNTVFKVSILAKFLMLGILKFSTLDPLGMGVEMEGGKPGWNDAMNGLPGILGSGMPETYEMLRILKYCRGAVNKYKRAVILPIEFTDLITHLVYAIDAFEASSKDGVAEFAYWDASNSAREAYRASIIASFQGAVNALSADYLVTVLDKMIAKVAFGVEKAVATTASGLSPTYFFYECTDFTSTPVTTTTPPSSLVTPKSFKVNTLPLFLEGPTRQLKIIDDLEARRNVYKLVKESPMYDTELQMYMLCESLASMGQDVGRMKAFSAGWLENQSIWLHMSYKFYLELLRGGLYQEFFDEIKTGLVPFMDPKIYGRSPLEAASFIVSSAFPDKKLHGTSFLARLSGSTAEFLSMWTLMMAGAKPFDVDAHYGALTLNLQPILPSWLFDENNEVSFTFLGEVQVTYVNPTKADTWTLTGTKTAKLVAKTGEVIEDDDGVLQGSLALRVRKLEIASIRITLA